MSDQENIRVTKRIIPGYTLTPCDGYYQVRKIGLTAQRVKKDPAFHNTRQQAKEFAAASTLSKNICDAVLPGTGIIGAASILTGALLKTIQEDKTQLPGHRKLFGGKGEALRGIELNPETSWHEVTTVPCRYTCDQEKQQLTAWLPAHIPATSICAPPDITHYRIRSAVISISSDCSITSAQWQQSSRFPCKQVTIPATTIICNINSTEQQWLLWLMSIAWYAPAKGSATVVRSRQTGPLIIKEVIKS